jgi:DNA-binding Xre family transcriptional regulator
VKWNLRMVAAQREIWKASELQRMLADAGLTVSAGKMSHLWSGRPVTIRLDDLDVICAVLSCSPADLLVCEPVAAAEAADAQDRVELPRAVGGAPVLQRRILGRFGPPL